MIKDNVERIQDQLPANVEVVAATKQRTVEEIIEAIDAGIKIVGENYVQEARRKFEMIGNKVQWHCIGHLQKNKVKPAVKIFDMIRTIDSIELIQLVDRECQKNDKIMPVLVEINSAGESRKTGILPGQLHEFIQLAKNYKYIKLMGLMTMGPFLEDEEKLRPYFKSTKESFDFIKIEHGDILQDWRYLSMGMSSSYKTAIQEGANLIRLGTIIFGPRRND